MNQHIKEIEVWLNRQKSGRKALTFSEMRESEGKQSWLFGDEKTGAEFFIVKEKDLLMGYIRVWMENQPFRENDNLSCSNPVEIVFGLEEKPKHMTAMYLHRDWWTRPAFISEACEIPARTQVLYMEGEGEAAALLLMAGKEMKTSLEGKKDGRLSLQMTAYRGGFSQAEEPVFILSGAEDIYHAVHRAFERAAEEKDIPMKEKREFPPMLEYLGWCSWDAFYTDITEDKVREKAEELKEKEIPVRWMLLDDGWLSVHGQRLYSLYPEKEKFPRGFPEMIREIKQKTDIRWFGVWHALGGYWGGIEPDSLAAVHEKKHLYETASGKLLPCPTPEEGFGFFRDWYEILRREGIDFVKVDGQSAVKNYYENEVSVCRAARSCHQALDGAASSYMGGRLINCMGMAMENLLGRPQSAVSRNSDDFVPDAKDGFAEHLLQNAYNAVYHDEMYYCDWDMFWTCHEDAKKHGILRAVSGGPVYVSDKTGESRKEAVMPLVYHDGRIIRMDRAAKPAAECIFSDPREGGILKLCTLGRCGNKKGGAVAAYHLGREAAESFIRKSDVYDLPEGAYYFYDCQSGTGSRMDEMGQKVHLEHNACGLYLMIPVEQGFAPVGLTDKYISFHAVCQMWVYEKQAFVILEEGGEFAFYSEKEVSRITVNGMTCTSGLTEENGLYRIRLEGTGKLMITIE